MSRTASTQELLGEVYPTLRRPVLVQIIVVKTPVDCLRGCRWSKRRKKRVLFSHFPSFSLPLNLPTLLPSYLPFSLPPSPLLLVVRTFVFVWVGKGMGGVLVPWVFASELECLKSGTEGRRWGKTLSGYIYFLLVKILFLLNFVTYVLFTYFSSSSSNTLFEIWTDGPSLPNFCSY